MELNRSQGNPVHSTRWLAVIIAMSIILRVAAALYLGDRVVDMPGTADQLSYHILAQRVLDGHGFTFPTEWWPVTAANAPTAHWSFLYTFYLIGVYAIFGVHPLAARLIQAIIVGVAHPVLAFQVGKIAFGSKTAVVSAVITTLYAYFVYYSGTLMTESFYISTILASLYLAILLAKVRPGFQGGGASARIYGIAGLLGISLAATVLLRQLFLLLIPFIFIWVLWAGGRSRVLPIILSGVIVLLAILPFTLFNYSRFNRFVLLNTNAGYAFYMGNHPIYGTKFIPILPSETYIRIIPAELRVLDEAALDQELLKRGLNFVIEDPLRYFLLSLSRIPAYFMFWPSGESGAISNLSRVGSFGLFLPFMIYGLGRAFMRWRRQGRELFAEPAFLLLLFIIIYAAIHLLTWALIRYRLPVDAVCIIFAGYALVTIFYRLFPVRRTVHTPSTYQSNPHS